MLRCNMTAALSLQLGLEDLLADLRDARRSGDLGRLALLAYCEVRRWAREAGNSLLAEHASELITGSPAVSREAFLGHIDELIHELEDGMRLAVAS
jgi:GMP synthase-like glutamine amidotransferase